MSPPAVAKEVKFRRQGCYNVGAKNYVQTEEEIGEEPPRGERKREALFSMTERAFRGFLRHPKGAK